MTYRTGLLLLTAAAMASFNDLIFRSLEGADACQAVVGRHLFMAGGMIVLTALLSRRNGARFTLSLSLPGLVACISSIVVGGSLYGFLMAVLTVATMTFFAVGLRWVRLAYNEVPTMASLAGGPLVLVSVIGFAISGMHRPSEEF